MSGKWCFHLIERMEINESAARIEIATTTSVIVIPCGSTHKYHDVRVTVQLIEIYFRTLGGTHVLATRAAVGAIFHLSKIDGVRAGHVHTRMIKFSRLRATTVTPRISARSRRERECNQYLHRPHSSDIRSAAECRFRAFYYRILRKEKHGPCAHLSLSIRQSGNCLSASLSNTCASRFSPTTTTTTTSGQQS